MTIETFNTTGFSAMSRVKYKDGNVYNIASVDFDESLIAIIVFPLEENIHDQIRWVRCENCTLIEE